LAEKDIKRLGFYYRKICMAKNLPYSESNEHASTVIRGDKCPKLFSDKHYELGGLSTREQIEAAAAQDISYELPDKEKSGKNERV
jgi:hypothetical protein